VYICQCIIQPDTNMFWSLSSFTTARALSFQSSTFPVRPDNNNALRNFKNIHELKLKLTIFAPKIKARETKKTEVHHPKSSRKADLSVKITEKISNSLLHFKIKLYMSNVGLVVRAVNNFVLISNEHFIFKSITFFFLYLIRPKRVD